MQRVFVYETLKKRKFQEEALGHDAKVGEQTTLPDYREIQIEKKGEKWPSLVYSPGSEAKGETLIVSQNELKKLDNWEDHYHRVPVMLHGKAAWVFKLKSVS